MHDEYYEFLVLLFGHFNALATFQSFMNENFKPCLHKFILVFFGDILIYNKGFDEHLLHLQEVLTLGAYQCVIDRKKCAFGRNQLEYSGHIVSIEGVEMNPRKI